MQRTEQPTRQELTTRYAHPAGRRRWGRFILHYLEMVVVMLVAMFVLGGALRALLAAGGVVYSMTRFPEVMILEMGLTMALGMAAWMRYRGHGWASTSQMSAAMLVPAVAAAPLVWLDVLGGGLAMALEHTAMFMLMLAVMLRRRDEYLTAHGRRGRGVRASGRGRVMWRLGQGLVALLGFLLIPAVAFAAGSTAYERTRYAQPETTAAAAAAVATATPPAHDPGKPTAVVVVGNRGANVADTLVRTRCWPLPERSTSTRSRPNAAWCPCSAGWTWSQTSASRNCTSGWAVPRRTSRSCRTCRPTSPATPW